MHVLGSVVCRGTVQSVSKTRGTESSLLINIEQEDFEGNSGLTKRSSYHSLEILHLSRTGFGLVLENITPYVFVTENSKLIRISRSSDWILAIMERKVRIETVFECEEV